MPTANSENSFVVVPGDSASRVIIHVPHASRYIPAWVRQEILLSDDALTHELDTMTDARTDEIAESAAVMSSLRPWLFVNRCSRLVIDPERFLDSRDEPMAGPEIGMGAVYTRTAGFDRLREDNEQHHQDLLECYFMPYAEALAQLIEGRLTALDSVTIIDLHSYPLVELPYERLHHAGAHRPECCIGVDGTHTPPALAAAAARIFADLGQTSVNEPFAGTYVPMKFYQARDTRVSSVMVELRRDAYLDVEGGISVVAGMLARLVDTVDAEIPEESGTSA